MNTFSLEIKTPDALVFSGDVESLIVPRPDGLEGYLANHEPVLVDLAHGTLEIKGSDIGIPETETPIFPITKDPSNKSIKIEITGGFLTFLNNRATIFIR